MNTHAKLMRLSTEIQSGQFNRSKNWQGADVVITARAPISEKSGFYPDPRYVVTVHASELSWLFEQLRDIFIEINDYGFLKEEIFGRLGNTANRFLSKNPDAHVGPLLIAVMHEAFAIAEEIQDDVFKALMVTSGNQIFDDLISESEKSGFLTIEETEAFFRAKGIAE